MKATILTIAVIVVLAMGVDMIQSCSPSVDAGADEAAAVIRPPIYPTMYPYISVKRTTLRNGDEIWIFASNKYAAAVRRNALELRRVACWYALPDQPYRDASYCPGTFGPVSSQHTTSGFLLDGKPADPLAGVATRGELAELRGNRTTDAGITRIAYRFDTNQPDRSGEPDN